MTDIEVTPAMIDAGQRTHSRVFQMKVHEGVAAIYRAMFALDPAVVGLREENDRLRADVDAVRSLSFMNGWLSAAKRLQDVAHMHGDPAIATAYWNAAEILLAAIGKRDPVQPETPPQSNARVAGEASQPFTAIIDAAMDGVTPKGA